MKWHRLHKSCELLHTRLDRTFWCITIGIGVCISICIRIGIGIGMTVGRFGERGSVPRRARRKTGEGSRLTSA